MRPDDYLAGKILIVDDESANVTLLERMLSRAGYGRLFSTTDSRKVVTLFQQHQPDLVLLDLLMPYLDGFEVMDLLRPLIGQSYLPILVLTADVTPQAMRRALSSGARDFLTKPFDQTELLLRVRNLLETRYLYLELQMQVQNLERLFEEAQQAIRLRDESLSAISHDIGQPLAALRLTAESLQAEVSESSAPRAPDLVPEIRRISVATEQMAAMIGELSDLSRLRMGRELQLQLQEVELAALVKSEVEAQRKAAGRQRIRIESGGEDLHGLWDQTRLRRVISNLLNNAIKYSSGRGEIVVELEKEHRDGREWALLVVRDQGVGIPAADLPYVFDWFHRAPNVVGRFAGSGIGLPGAKQIVEQHGGKIEVESEEGRGTTVRVLLPLA